MEPTDTQLPATITQAEIITPPDVHTSLIVPALIADVGDDASWRYVEFFTANIRNRNTRRAYFVAVSQFSKWCDQKKLRLEDIQPIHVAAYIEQLGAVLAKPSVKQHLAAIRMLFDWLVTGQVMPTNPAHEPLSTGMGSFHLGRRTVSPGRRPRRSRTALFKLMTMLRFPARTGCTRITICRSRA